jgi:signal transduction histidine kinase
LVAAAVLVPEQNRDKQRLAEQQRGAAILKEQLAERERQRRAAEELRDQVGRGLLALAGPGEGAAFLACMHGWLAAWSW